MREIPIEHLVFCPKEDAEVTLEDCEECEYNGGSDNYDITCKYEAEEKMPPHCPICGKHQSTYDLCVECRRKEEEAEE